MKIAVVASLALTAALAGAVAQSPAQPPAAPAACNPGNAAKFVCGLRNPEDLVSVPGAADWIIGSGLAVANQPGTNVSHLQITGSPIGITDGAGVAAPGVVTISDVIISGGAAFAQRGVEISNSTGTFNFDGLQLSNLSNGGVILAADGLSRTQRLLTRLARRWRPLGRDRASSWRVRR